MAATPRSRSRSACRCRCPARPRSSASPPPRAPRCTSRRSTPRAACSAARSSCSCATPRPTPTRRCGVAREMILKDNVDFLVGTLTSAEGPAVSVVAKENKIVFIAPIPKTDQLTAADKLHPYVFRIAANTTMEGRSAAEIVAKWPVDQGRHHRLRLRLRPGRDQGVRRAHQEAQARHRDRRPAVAEARRAGLQPVHQRPDGQEARGDRARRSGAATSSPSPSRPRPSACSTRSSTTSSASARRHAGDDASRWAPTIRSASGATPTTPSTGARPRPHTRLHRAALQVPEGRVPVVVGHPGLHRHAVPGRGASRRPAAPTPTRSPRPCSASPSTRRSASRRSARRTTRPNRGQLYGKMVKDPKYPFAIMKPVDVRRSRPSSWTSGRPPCGRVSGRRPCSVRTRRASPPPAAALRTRRPRSCHRVGHCLELARCRIRRSFSRRSLSGLTAAMFLFLIASGLSLIFGVLRVLNFAHGSFYMLGRLHRLPDRAVARARARGGSGSAVLGAALGVALLGGIVERCPVPHSTARRSSTSCCSPTRWC